MGVARTLTKPPIVEVVCGFFFPPIAVTPLFVGKYWAAKKEKDFPRTDLQPAVFDRPSVVLGGGVSPVRSWLLSAEEDLVLQIQPDRFYLNWRRQGDGAYPHFEDHGEVTGVLSRSLAELSEFSAFTREHLAGVAPQPRQLELTKVDFLERGKHWSDVAELARLVPWLAASPAAGEGPEIALAANGQRAGFRVAIALRTMVNPADLSAALHIETRVTGAVGADPRVTFTSMNDVANDMFFDLLSAEARSRFGETT